jgi:quinol monooxygenase YgiN
MFVVTVEFEVRPEAIDRFKKLILENAATSRDTEPGCRRFDVCIDPAAPTSVFLYEVYDDRRAFDVHLTLPHFRGFDASAKPLVLSKRVRLFSLVSH